MRIFTLRLNNAYLQFSSVLNVGNLHENDARKVGTLGT